MAEIREPVKLPGKRGSFFIRKLGLSEAFSYMQSMEGMADVDIMAKLVQMTLVKHDNKPVYTANQMAKMDAELGGFMVITLAAKSRAFNQIDKLTEMDKEIRAAEKN